MNPDTLLTELKTRGIGLRVAGDRLMLSDPEHGLTPGLRALISLHKPALIERLPFGVMSDAAEHEHDTPSDDSPAIAVTFDAGTSTADRLRVWQALGDPRVAIAATEVEQARRRLLFLIGQTSDQDWADQDWPATLDQAWPAEWDRACARYHAARVAFETIPIA